MSPTALSEILQKFFAEVKTEKGQALLQVDWLELERPSNLCSTQLKHYYFEDCEFKSANKMFEAKAKLFRKENNAKPKHKSSIQ